MMKVPKVYKRIARMSGPELWAAYTNPKMPAVLPETNLPTWHPDYHPTLVTETSLIAVEVKCRILASKPFKRPPKQE